jgi:TatD DNase family protein
VIRYIDTHCHLAARHFDADADEVARRSLARGVGILTVAADLASSYRSLAIAERHDGVLASVGVHPNDASDLDDESWAEIVNLARSPKVAAIGETGLDYYWKDTPREVQKKWFLRHIELSIASGKPLSVHARDSVADTLDLLRPHLKKGLKAVWHCFVAGKKDIAGALDFAVEHGLYLAVGGLVTFEDQKPLRNHVPRIPDELLLLETDAPYLVPRPKTMDRNEPVGVIRVAEVLAELRGATPEHIAETTTRNAAALFGFEIAKKT